MAENFLSQEEVDDLLKGVTGEKEPEAAPESPEKIRPYNLATQERIVRGRMPTLEMLNERFARYLRIGLYNYVRKSADVTALPVRVIKYSEFIRNLVVPTSLNLVQLRPFRGHALVVLDPNLVFIIIDSLFGGNGKFHTRVEGRDFTLTEQQIIRRVLDIIFEHYAKAWEPVHTLTPEYIRSEINTQFVNIATPNEAVIATTFRIDLGGTSAELHLCIPYSLTEPVRDKLTSSLQGEALDQDSRWIGKLKEQIQTAEVDLVVNLGSTVTTIGALQNLKVGDFLPIVKPDILTATVDGVPVLEGDHGKLRGQYAIKVRRMLSLTGNEIPPGDVNGRSTNPE